MHVETAKPLSDYMRSDFMLVNPCNLEGAAGRGISLWYKKQFPIMYEVYAYLCKTKQFTFGDNFLWETSETTVASVPTKTLWRQGAKLDLIERGLKTLRGEARQKNKIVVMPRIGSGLGGLDWEKQVRPLVKRELHDVEVIVARGYMEEEPTPYASELFVNYSIVRW